MTYIGVDIGTSVIKAAAFDTSGRQCALESVPATLSSPRPGWFEQDMDAVVAAVADVVRRVAGGGSGRPDLIALTGQGDGVWLTDEDGRAVRPAVSWMDARAADILAGWQAAGVVTTAFRRTGGAMFPGSPGPVLAWLDRHEPEVLDRASTAGYCKDVVMQRLTGVRATDVSDASQPFLDPMTQTYAVDVLAGCGLEHRAGLLAPVAEPVVLGSLTADAAEMLGVALGVPVSSGPFDLPACALGSGVTEPGQGHLIVGTTLACQVVVDSIDTTGEPAGLTLATGKPGRWLRAMPAMVGTAALDWVLATIGARHVEVDGMLAATEPSVAGVSCLPYFSPAGERAPFVEAGARARFDGLTVHTTKADLVRAVCEAIALAARHCFERAGLFEAGGPALGEASASARGEADRLTRGEAGRLTRGEVGPTGPDGTVTCCGGGIRSRTWLQLFADVLGRELRVASKPEVGAFGAVLAGAGARGVDTTDWAEPDLVVQPSPALVGVYAEMYDRYRAAVDRARADWHQHTGTGSHLAGLQSPAGGLESQTDRLESQTDRLESQANRLISRAGGTESPTQERE